MSDLYEARNSIYCYPDSNVLKNKFNIKDSKLLEELERKITLVKLFELRQNNNIGNFDINHLINIHKFLFEDIYPFAGLFRTENIAKDNFSFAEWQYIEEQLKNLLDNLKQENYLANLDTKTFIKRLAYFMSELNVLHPFREGNGRVIREFIRQLAFKNGYLLDLQDINPKEMLAACIRSVVDTSNLENILSFCLKKI